MAAEGASSSIWRRYSELERFWGRITFDGLGIAGGLININGKNGANLKINLPVNFAGGLNINGADIDTLFWKTSGNQGIMPGQYLGTSDNTTLFLAVNETAAMQYNWVGDANDNTLGVNITGGFNSTPPAGGVYGATVAGGGANSASKVFSTVGGGNNNTASGPGAFVGGGGYDGNGSSGNTASGFRLGGLGGLNDAAAELCFPSGSVQADRASANWAAVPGGFGSTAAGI